MGVGVGDRADLVLERPSPRADADLLHLFGRAFGGKGGYEGFLAFCRGYFPCPTYDRDASAAGRIGDAWVTHVGVWRYRMRLGGAALKVAGVGLVATDPDHQGRGYMASAMARSLEWMREGGYHITILFGRAALYTRFGYTRSWDDRQVRARAGELGTTRRGVVLERASAMSPLLWRRLGALYNREHAGLTGTALRPTFGVARMSDLACVLWPSRAFPAGYLLCASRSGVLEVVDAAGSPAEVLGVARGVAEARGLPEVRFLEPHLRSPLGQAIAAIPGAVVTRSGLEGGPMALILDTRRTLEAMAPELGRRLARASRGAGGAAGGAGGPMSARLLLEGDTGSPGAVLAITRGRVRVEGPGPADGRVFAPRGLAPLILGRETPAALETAGELTLEGSARELAPTLFPPLEPGLGAWDHF